jgi:hypothetical protein
MMMGVNDLLSRELVVIDILQTLFSTTDKVLERLIYCRIKAWILVVYQQFFPLPIRALIGRQTAFGLPLFK